MHQGSEFRQGYSKIQGRRRGEDLAGDASGMVGLRRVGKQIVNVPSFLVRVDSQKHIDFALNSPFGGGRPGRNKRRNLK